jgi:hypothetical protein
MIDRRQAHFVELLRYVVEIIDLRESEFVADPLPPILPVHGVERKTGLLELLFPVGPLGHPPADHEETPWKLPLLPKPPTFTELRATALE